MQPIPSPPPNHHSYRYQQHLVAGRKRNEVDVRRRHGVVAERPLDRVEVVRPDSDEGAASADVLVQLVLHPTPMKRQKRYARKKKYQEEN